MSVNGRSKAEIVSRAIRQLLAEGFEVVDIDMRRPWGIELCIDQSQAKLYLEVMFHGAPLPASVESAVFDPKLLLIAPDQRLSWHVHERKEEFLRVQQGLIGEYRSSDDELPPTPRWHAAPSPVIHVPPGTRHRFEAGPDRWAFVAEVARSIDPLRKRDVPDKRRIVDDYGRV